MLSGWITFVSVNSCGNIFYEDVKVIMIKFHNKINFPGVIILLKNGKYFIYKSDDKIPGSMVFKKS